MPFDYASRSAPAQTFQARCNGDKDSSKRTKKCFLLPLCLVGAAGRKEHLHARAEDFCTVKGLDKEWTGARPGLPVFFRRACGAAALWMFEHLQWQWITPAGPLWFHLHLGSCCRKSTADSPSQALCTAASHIASPGSSLFYRLISFCQTGSPGEHNLNKTYLNCNYLIMFTEKKSVRV